MAVDLEHYKQQFHKFSSSTKHFQVVFAWQIQPHSLHLFGNNTKIHILRTLISKDMEMAVVMQLALTDIAPQDC